MSETIESWSLDTSSFQIEDLKELLNKIWNISDSDFATLDKDDTNLSEAELKVKEELEKSNDQVMFIKEMIKSIEWKITNKEVNELWTENINEKLQNIWDNYKFNSEWKETNVNSINNKIKASKRQKELISETYPELSESPFVSDTHIRAFNEKKWEYVISAEDLNIKLWKQWVEWSSYLEIMRYLKWIEKTKWNNNNLTLQLTTIFEDIIKWNIENSKYKKEIYLLQQYLPKSFLEEGNLKKFAEEFNVKINEFNIERAYAAENKDETNEWELELIIDNLINNLWENEAHRLMQQCVKAWLNRDESIMFLSQYSVTLKTEIETYKIKNKEYYESKKVGKKEQNQETISNTKNKSKNEAIQTTKNNYIPSFWDNTKSIEWLTITNEERALITNKEIEKNLINSFLTLKEVWLENLWERKNDIATAIWSISWSVINIKDNFFDENELKIFLNGILLSVWEEKIDSSKDIGEFKNIFKNKNDVQIWGWFKDENYDKWVWKIWEKFTKKYITWYSKFQTEAFKKSLTK